jgi:lambda repressor-like predicted transcriptional regulator
MTQVSTRGVPFFPAAPARRLLARVVADCDGNLSAASVALHVDRSTLHRLLSRDRLRSDAADRIAVALGRHPSELWPQWFDDEQVSR